jgi:hypothetical protein
MNTGDRKKIFYFYCDFTQVKGRAIAQAVSRWLPTAATWVGARVWSCGICDGQSGAGAGFLRVFRFSLPIFIPPITPQSPLYIIWGWYNRPVVAAVPSGLSLTPLRIPRLEMDIQRLCTPWLVVRKRTILTERQPLVSEVSDNYCG